MPRGEDCDPLPQRSTTFLGSQSQRDKGNRRVSKSQRGRASSPWSKCLRSVEGVQEHPGAGGRPSAGSGEERAQQGVSLFHGYLPGSLVILFKDPQLGRGVG